MSKPVLGLILGAILGVFDGLTALFTPEAAPMITSIIMWSSLKGLIAGLIIGFFARKVHSVQGGILFGGAVGLLLAFLVALAPSESGQHYWIEIMVPGTIVGLILGFATQKYGKEPKAATAS
jgi:hypothetical protein